MRLIALVLSLLVQMPEIRIAPSPLPSVPKAEAVLKGLRIIEVTPAGVNLRGSACPIGGFGAYTALHVVNEVKGQLLALPNFGYNFDEKVMHRVHVTWKDEKRDLALLVPDSPDDAFLYWYTRGPVPKAGAEVRGVLVLPRPAFLAVPSFGIFYGLNDDFLWSSQMAGPGSSGSCVLDDQDRVFGILKATASWGESPGAHAAVSVRIPEK